MKQINKQYIYIYILLSLLTFITFFTPTLIYSFINKNFVFLIRSNFIGLFLPLSFALAGSKNKVVYSILSIFIIMELIQFGHMFYFGTPISVFVIELIFFEYTEIIESGLGMGFLFLLYPLIIIIPYGLLIFIYHKSSKIRKQFNFPIFFIILIFLYFPHRLLRKQLNLNSVVPDTYGISVYNDLRVFTGFFMGRLPKIIKGDFKNKQFTKYKDYIFDKIPTANNNYNIVLIFGESISSSHVGALGYIRNTTPFLSQQKTTNKNFIIKEAFSSAVSTHVSANMFFNLRREPDNLSNYISKNHNLFDFAINNGFETFYISAQNRATMYNLYSENIKHIITYENYKEQFKKYGDTYLLKLLEQEKNKFKKNNFIVIHKRAIHSPYFSSYRFSSKKYSIFNDTKYDKRINDYDNAMVYEDYLITEIIDFFQNSQKPTYIFYVPDHAELLNVNGTYGHGILLRETAEIPFIGTIVNMKDDNFIARLNSLNKPTHYEIAKIILEIIGYKLINPNENGDFYINGPNIIGEAGFLIIDR